MKKIRNLPQSIVAIPPSSLNSALGRYFIAQSGTLNFGAGNDAWAGLINPIKSGINLFFDIFTITDFSAVSFTSEIWLNANAPENSKISTTVTPSNQAINPPPKPRVMMKYSDRAELTKGKGVNIFDRIVPANSTLVSDSHQGSMILPPGGSFSILLKSPGIEKAQATIVLTWWEERK